MKQKQDEVRRWATDMIPPFLEILEQEGGIIPPHVFTRHGKDICVLPFEPGPCGGGVSKEALRSWIYTLRAEVVKEYGKIEAAIIVLSIVQTDLQQVSDTESLKQLVADSEKVFVFYLLSQCRDEGEMMVYTADSGGHVKTTPTGWTDKLPEGVKNVGPELRMFNMLIERDVPPMMYR